MIPSIHTRVARPTAVLLLALLVLSSLSACAAGGSRVAADSPELATYIELVSPARIKVLSWTKPVSLAGDGNADALEVIIAAYDSFDDVAKVVGSFHFELLTRRLSDRMGTRVAFWSAQIDSAESMRDYLVHPSGFYRFPLELSRRPLPAGRYVLNVQVQLPTGQRLFDEYELEYDGTGAPAVSPM